MVDGIRERRLPQHGVDRRPDVEARYLPVLQPERDVTSHRRGHHRGCGVLQEQCHVTGLAACREAVDVCLACLVPGCRGVQQPGHGAQQGRLPGTARPRDEHALAGLDVEVELGQHRRTTAERSPGQATQPTSAPSARAHRDLVRDRRRQTACRSAASRPAGSASMAPVAASARVSAQPPSPATTAPDSTKKPR